MITQFLKTELSSAIAKFGNGDISIGMASVKDSPEVLITFSNIKKSEIGKEVTNEVVESTPIILSFDSVDSLKVLSKVVNKAIIEMKQKEEDNKRKEMPHFIVRLNNIFVTNAFKNTNPNAEKIINCQKYFTDNKKLDKPIEVTNTLTLKDEYVRYLVAIYNGLEKVEVIAPNGIDIKVGNTVINFVSSEVETAFNLDKDEDGNEKFCLILKNGGKKYVIPAEDNIVAARMIKKITEVFDAKIVIPAVSTLNYGLNERLNELGIKVSYL